MFVPLRVSFSQDVESYFLFYIRAVCIRINLRWPLVGIVIKQAKCLLAKRYFVKLKLKRRSSDCRKAGFRFAHRYVQYTPPTRLNCRVESRAVWTEFATSLRRLPTDSVDNLETDQADSIAVWLREFRSMLITFSTVTSSCRHLSPTSITQQQRKM